MTPDTIPARSIAALRRPTAGAMVMALMLLTSAFWLAGLAAPTPAHAAGVSVEQCNGHGPGATGATTALKCTVTVVNTISGTATSSTTTVTRLCTLGPCSSPNGRDYDHFGRPGHGRPATGLVLVAAVGALLYRRYAPEGFLSRYIPAALRGRFAQKADRWAPQRDPSALTRGPYGWLIPCCGRRWTHDS